MPNYQPSVITSSLRFISFLLSNSDYYALHKTRYIHSYFYYYFLTPLPPHRFVFISFFFSHLDHQNFCKTRCTHPYFFYFFLSLCYFLLIIISNNVPISFLFYFNSYRVITILSTKLDMFIPILTIPSFLPLPLHLFAAHSNKHLRFGFHSFLLSPIVITTHSTKVDIFTPIFTTPLFFIFLCSRPSVKKSALYLSSSYFPIIIVTPLAKEDVFTPLFITASVLFHFLRSCV